MPVLIVNPGDAAAWRLELPEGSSTLGRTAAQDLSLDHDSVSEPHCAFHVAGDAVSVQDLGSAQGTFIDGQPITSARLEPGQWLQIGAVQLRRESPLDQIPRALPRPRPTTGPKPGDQAMNLSLGGRVLDALQYPLRGDGWIVLLLGTVFLIVMNFASNFVFLAGVLVTGYLVAFLQKIIQSSAAGDRTVPSWPEFGDWWSDIVQPFLQFTATVLLLITAPLVLLGWKAVTETPGLVWGAWLWLGLGVLLTPMALLAVAMSDSLAALNPWFLFRSIAAAPGDYLGTSIIFGLPLALQAGLDVLAESGQASWTSAIVSSVLGLYFLVMQMRLLGLYYFANRQRLGWFE